MVEHHRRSRNRFGKVAEGAVLEMEMPGVPRHPTLAEPRDAGAEGVAFVEAGAGAAGNGEAARVGRVGAGVADAAEPPAGRLVMRVERLVEQGVFEVRMGDDPRNDGAPRPAPGGFGDVGDEAGLSDRAQMLGGVHVPMGAAFEKHGLAHIVARPGVGPQMFEQVARTAAVPEMVVGVDDLAPGVEDRFVGEREPVVAHRQSGDAHASGLDTRRGGSRVGHDADAAFQASAMSK